MTLDNRAMQCYIIYYNYSVLERHNYNIRSQIVVNFYSM